MSRPSPRGSGRVAEALAVPLQNALGAALIDPDDPQAGVRFAVRGLACTPAGTLHAGALAGVLELAGYLAVLPELGDKQHAVTHAISAQYVAAAKEGADVTVVGRLVRRARSVAFLAVTAAVADRIIAEAQITKSIIDLG